MRNKYLCISIFAFCFSASQAVTLNLDSLKQLYNTAKDDKAKLALAYQVGKEFNHESQYDSALKYVDIGLALAKKLDEKNIESQLLRTLGNICNAKGEYKKAITAYEGALKLTDTVNDKDDAAKLLNNMGTVCEKKSDFSAAYKYFQRALAVFQEAGDKKGVAEAYSNFGLIYHDQGNNPKAIEYNLQALKVEESLNESYMIANDLNNIGNIYADEKDYKQAIDYYMRAEEKYKQGKYKVGVGQVYGNIGLVYQSQGNYDKALEYFSMSLPIAQQLGVPRDIGDAYSDIGSTYFLKKDLKPAMENDQKALEIFQSIGDKQGTAEVLNNLGKVYYASGKYADAQKEEEEALQIATAINDPVDMSNINKELSKAYEKTKQPDKALEHYKMYVTLHDSLNNEENSKQVIRSQMAYQFEKEQQALALQQDKKDAIAAEASRRQKAILYFVIGILVLVLVFAVVMVNRFVVIRHQKKTIEEQKGVVENKNKIIEEKNKDITDSINYAKDIQRALLPNEQEFKEVFPESFVLYMPKDIVSGDFYWMAEKDGKALLLAADCTGHGVPGALMSMIGVSLFNEAVSKKDIIQPGHILNEVRTGIINTFKQKSDTQHKDGMDAALCSIDLKTMNVEFAGAYNPLWLINKNGEVREIAPDKQPVGIQDGQKPTFTTQTIHLEKGDTVYLFSDGYADQFGGPNGKKFKYKQFQELLLSINKMSLAEQREVLEKKYLDWKGLLEQVDDVLVMGIRV
jgi:tetratricopeptide (TPR) repeat protein